MEIDAVSGMRLLLDIRGVADRAVLMRLVCLSDFTVFGLSYLIEGGRASTIAKNSVSECYPNANTMASFFILLSSPLAARWRRPCSASISSQSCPGHCERVASRACLGSSTDRVVASNGLRIIPHRAKRVLKQN